MEKKKGLSFSSTQIENMTSELYIALCSKYDIYSYDWNDPYNLDTF